MEKDLDQPSPEGILQIASGFWASKILLAAVKFDLFTFLAREKTMSAGQIKDSLKLKCSDRNVYDFLDALTALKFLNREGLLADALYSNSIHTDTFLDKHKESYIGGLLEMLNSRIYHHWGNLEEGLLTGGPQNETKEGSENFFSVIYQDPQKLRGFINAMSGIQRGNFMTFAQKFDFSRYNTLTDAGGAGSMFSLTVAKYHPHMICTSFDLPIVVPIAIENIQRAELQNQVKTASGDFFNDPIPPADVVVMGNILHDWDEEKKLMLIKKAYDAVNHGGAFVAIENVIDDERRHNVFGMMMSLNMLIETGKGFDYTFNDFNKWVTAAGFRSTELISLAGPSSAAIAYK
ncbi:methyltransferase [Pedobacter sp.]|uniref:methyltransferase n=1 Tax=Pedobacter sp. TaxID=1411316 RepID=UPI003D7FC35C